MHYHWGRLRRNRHLFPLGRGSILPFSDDFDRANGPLGGLWTGGTWTIAGNEAINTPTVGGELLANGNMETATPPGTWVPWIGNWNGAADERTGGAGIQSGEVERAVAGGIQNYAYQALGGLTIGQWLYISGWQKNVTNGDWNTTIYLGQANLAAVSAFVMHTTSTWTMTPLAGRVLNATMWVALHKKATVDGRAGRFDDVSCKPLTLASLFASVEADVADVVATVELDTVAATTPAGVVLNLDSVAAPANFAIGYHDGTNCNLDKCVAGTYTSVISAAAAYAAGANIRVVKSGTSYSLYYNGVQIGATQTISDAGIINNTRHGIFSTHSGNELDNFSLTK